MKTAIARALVLSAAMLVANSAAHGQDFPEFNRDPDQARVIAEDLHRFWVAWDLAEEYPDRRREIFQREYLDAGSAGLQAFLELRIEDVDRLLAAIDAAPEFYASIRRQMDHVPDVQGPVREALRRLHDLLPDAVFPDTYLLIGVANSAGTIHPDGLLIGFEMNARGPDTPMDELGHWHHAVIRPPSELPALIVHELLHYQQAVHGRLDFTDLLGQSIAEGAADFVTHLVMGRNPMQHIHEWAEPREAELWAEFREVMHGSDTSEWLYQGNRATDRPADLGYFIGYRIAEAFYDAADDEATAVREIVGMTDPADFLARSGYVPNSGVAPP